MCSAKVVVSTQPRPQQRPHNAGTTHLLLSAGLVALLLLLGVAKDGEGARDLAGLDGGEVLAEVLGKLLDERGVEAARLVAGGDGDDDVARELVKVGLGGGLGGEDVLERVGWVSVRSRGWMGEQGASKVVQGRRPR